jgi:hypothetical protein
MGYDMGLGGYWPAANCYAVFLWYYLCTYVVPAYLRTNVPSYIMHDSLLYLLLNYLHRSSNLLTYLLTYELTYMLTYVATYQHSNLPMYLCTYVPTYLCTYYVRTFFGIIYVPMYSTFLPMYLHAYVPIMYDSLLYWLLNYLRRSSNLLTYLLTYIDTYDVSCKTTILHGITAVPSESSHKFPNLQKMGPQEITCKNKILLYKRLRMMSEAYPQRMLLRNDSKGAITLRTPFTFGQEIPANYNSKIS